MSLLELRIPLLLFNVYILLILAPNVYLTQRQIYIPKVVGSSSDLNAYVISGKGCPTTPFYSKKWKKNNMFSKNGLLC